MRKITIEMPYQIDLSVNHYKGRRRYGGEFVKRKVQDWKDMLGWQVKSAHLEDWKLPLIVRLDAVFPDRRIRDLSNFSKVILDTIEDVTGINDTNFRWHDGKPLAVSLLSPKLIITITER